MEPIDVTLHSSREDTWWKRYQNVSGTVGVFLLGMAAWLFPDHTEKFNQMNPLTKVTTETEKGPAAAEQKLLMGQRTSTELLKAVHALLEEKEKEVGKTDEENKAILEQKEALREIMGLILKSSQYKEIQLLQWAVEENEKITPTSEEERRVILERKINLKRLLAEKKNKEEIQREKPTLNSSEIQKEKPTLNSSEIQKEKPTLNKR